MRKGVFTQARLSDVHQPLCSSCAQGPAAQEATLQAAVQDLRAQVARVSGGVARGGGSSKGGRAARQPGCRAGSAQVQDLRQKWRALPRLMVGRHCGCAVPVGPVCMRAQCRRPNACLQASLCCPPTSPCVPLPAPTFSYAQLRIRRAMRAHTLRTQADGQLTKLRARYGTSSLEARASELKVRAWQPMSGAACACEGAGAGGRGRHGIDRTRCAPRSPHAPA